MFKNEPQFDTDAPEPREPTRAVSPPPTASANVARAADKAIVSIIEQDLTVTGNIVSKGEVQIEGEVEGDIHCVSLIVGKAGHVSGGVVAESVVVRGRLVGSIRGADVILEPGSHVEGDVLHKAINIQNGAYFEGRSRRLDDTELVAAQTAGAARSPSPQEAV